MVKKISTLTGMLWKIFPYSLNLKILPLKLEWLFLKDPLRIKVGGMSIGSLNKAIV